MGNIHSLRDAWTAFLGQFEPFDWYLTLTFREEVHPEQADKRFRSFARSINERLFGSYYRKKGLGIRWVRALEYQKRGVLHFHALMGGGLDKLEKTYFKDLWNRENGFAKIETYKPQRGACGYLSKYVMKGGQIDFFYSPTKQSHAGCYPKASNPFNTNEHKRDKDLTKILGLIVASRLILLGLV